MKRFSFNFSNIIYYLILALPLVLTKQVLVLGENILPLVVIVLEVALICKRILDNKGRKFLIKSYPIDKYMCFFIMVYTLGKILSFTFGISSNAVIMDMEFYTLIFAVTLLYLLMDFQGNINPQWQKIAVSAGTVGSFLIFLSFLKDKEFHYLTDALTKTGDGIVSYLLVVNLLCITNWILNKEENKFSNLWLAVTGFNMFVLLLKRSHISNWMIVFCLLSVAAFFRPRASLIKKVGILLFLFLFLWSNMSLVLNYTQWFQVDAVYSLETSVYMELCLALGGLLFFHFWDRIPEGTELDKLSMVKMQHYFRMVLGVLAFIFLIFVMGGNVWSSLADDGLKGFVKALALPLHGELTKGSSTIFIWLTKLGVVGVLLLLIWFYQMGMRMYKRCGVDQERENCFLIYYLAFLFSIFMWEVPGNVLLVFVFLVSMGNVKPKLIEIETEEENKEIEENVKIEENQGGEKDEEMEDGSSLTYISV